MGARFEIVRTPDEQPWHVRLVANGRITWRTENYVSQTGAEKAVVSLARSLGLTANHLVWNVEGVEKVIVGQNPSHILAPSVIFVDERPPRTRATVDELFWAKVKKTDACWIWTAGSDREGYGLFAVERRKQRAHRVAYELVVGPIPDGFEIDHLCYTPSCVNPDHLEAVTGEENRRRALERRGNLNRCKNGHERTPENTYVGPSGKRACRACQGAAATRYKAKRRAS